MKNWNFVFIVSTLLLLCVRPYTFASDTSKHPSSPITANDSLMNTASKFVEEKLKEGKKPNRLIHEKSPYLLQHAHNPVDWYPWGQEAFKKAHAENKPIFLSIGYSTCHWCHVMERESFENEQIAGALNRDFVPIKVDREERPDIDSIYMSFVQATTGGGGWPMSVWLTPDLKPFTGGTYFPPDDRFGRPGFQKILERIAEAWRTDREQIVASSVDVIQQLQKAAEAGKGAVTLLNKDLLDTGF